MKLYYDFHIHSCLSPCGDEDMTPNNIVNMALLSGLNAIALTDHNTCGNCPATAQVAAEAGLLFLPGMELCTAEEAHVVCLFPTVEAALAFEAVIAPTLPPIRNRADVFGEQVICNTLDEPIGTQDILLTTASSISVDAVPTLVRSFGGTAFPTHIDRPSYSVTAALGDLPPLGFEAVELTATADVDTMRARYREIGTKPLLLNSDAHRLEDIQEAGPWLELPALTPTAVIDALNGNFTVEWSRG
ncbi:MAG: PHP domain-containing protein [Clostridia bacterium]|nr:PHP domain-containing protein [Clostridia bacterium]